MIASRQEARFSISKALLIATGIALFFGFKALSGSLQNIDLVLDSDPDSNMRLQQVRDLLAGQGWFDLVLNRYGIDGGVSMHWSRLADIGPAALLLAFRSFMGEAQSETAMSIAYPLLLIIPFVVALIWTTQRMIASQPTLLVGFAVALVSLTLTMNWAHFSPGNIDHHNLQLIALIIFLGACSGKRDFRSGLIAASAFVLGLVIGLDSVPAVAATLVGLGILWLIDPEQEADFLSGLGIGICALTILSAGIFIPRPFSNQWCDSWTVPLSAITFGLGIFLIFASALGRRVQNRYWLCGASLLAGILLLGALLALFPACRNPLPLEGILIERYWMASIQENQPIWTLIKNDFPKLFLILPAVLAQIAYMLALKKNWMSNKDVLPLIFAGWASFAFGCLYYRGIPVMTAVIIPILAGTFASALSNTSNGTERMRVWLALTPLVALNLASVWTQSSYFSKREMALSESQKKNGESTLRNSCLVPKSFNAIDELPHGIMISSFMDTELLMRHSKMQVAFAGYHRDYKSNLLIMKWLIGKPDAAYEAFKRHGVRYLNVCELTGQFSMMAQDHPDGVLGLITRNQVPNWLVPVLKVEQGGMIYEVR